VAATTEFYTRILGMELASTIFDDKVPSTGDTFPYFHIFLRMGDGSTLAFFECADLALPAKSSHPAYGVFNHIALQVDGSAELVKWRDWFAENGLDVIGPVDHKGLIQCIYFHDPNGVRLELTTPIDPNWNRHAAQGFEDLKLWVEAKERAPREGKDVAPELLSLINRVKQQRDDSKPKSP